jgi:hypothetical protein
MAKFRSKTNYAQIYSGDKQGFNLGIDGAIYLKRETTPRVFNPPTIGTQGKSLGGVSASTDITAAATPATLKATVSGGTQVTASIAVAGLNTGNLIAAALETAINSALAADGQDARVWVQFNGAGPDQYTVWNQSTGIAATVVIANGTSNNIADDLKLGTANGGTESAGTDDQDFLLYTTGGMTYNQPVESNAHRSGRFHTGIIRKKKVAEFDFSTYVNMSGSAGASIDTAVQLLIESALGRKTTGATFIDFEQDLPIISMSMVRVSTIFGEYFTGGYVRDMELDFPGDGPATVKYSGKAAKSFIAGIGQLNGAVSGSTDVILNAGESERFEANGRVMMVGVDGRTITAGQDGSLYVVSVDDSLETVVLSAAVTVADDSYIVPWDPGAVGQTARDAIYTDLVGSAKLHSSLSAVDLTASNLKIANDHTDFDNRFGADANKGFAAAARMTATLSMTFDLSNETFGQVVRTREFSGFSPQIVLGDEASGRFLKITAPKWIPSVPNIEVPDSGVTTVTLEGTLYQSGTGKKDPLKLRYG